MVKDRSFEKALNFSLHLLNFRQRSEKELRDKLELKKFSQDIIDQLFLYLKKLGLIDDVSFAQAWVNTRMMLKPSGLFKLKYELIGKGIRPKIIDEVLDNLKNECNLKEVALGLARKKISASKLGDKNKLKRRLYDYLRRRGFSGEVVFSVMHEVFKNFYTPNEGDK